MRLAEARPVVYSTEHQHSRIICGAFAEGCQGRIVPAHRLLDGPAVMYGILRGTGEILKQCEWVGRDYYYIDHGYVGARHYDGYYRVSKNGRQAVILGDAAVSSERWEKLRVPILPWRKNGRHVLVIPLTGAIAGFYGIDPKMWLDAVSGEVSKFTDRPILTKKKEEGELFSYLEDAWCVVTHSSNVAVDALLCGVPAVTLGESVVAPVSWGLVDIEKPVWRDRMGFFGALASHQFTFNEFRSGYAWEHVR